MNSGHLKDVLRLSNWSFIVGPAVYKEIAKQGHQKEILDECLVEGSISLFDKELDIEAIDNMFTTYDLGDGETETLVICNEYNFQMCCDDKSARNMAETEIGSSNTMGSLRLLKYAVDENIIFCTQAYDAYNNMITNGGFLPKSIDHHFFCNSS